MEDYGIVLMLRNKETGFLEKELGSYRLAAYENLVSGIYAEATDAEPGYHCHMLLTTDRPLEDWAFEAVYDYYDGGVYAGRVLSFTEVADCYSPTWAISFPFDEDPGVMESAINTLLRIHNEELDAVFAVIQDKRDEYDENRRG